MILSFGGKKKDKTERIKTLTFFSHYLWIFKLVRVLSPKFVLNASECLATNALILRGIHGSLQLFQGLLHRSSEVWHHRSLSVLRVAVSVHLGCSYTIPETGGPINHRNLFLTPGGRKSKVRAPAWLGSGEVFQVAHCWLLLVSSRGRGGDRAAVGPLL